MNQLAVSLARIADGIGTLLNSPIIIAVIALFGVVLTARSSRNVAFAQNIHDRLVTYYAEVFSNYATFTNSDVANRTGIRNTLFASCEKATLLCSDESRELLRHLEFEIALNTFDSDSCGKVIGQLRESARADLESIIPRTPWYKRPFRFLNTQFITNTDNQNNA